MGDPFEAIVGAAHVVRPDADELCGARVLAVVRPADADEVAACLRAATDARVPVLPVCGGSKLGFGNPLDARECVRLELGRVCARVALDPDEGVAEIDAGVPLDALARAAADVGKTTAFDALQRGASVGGSIAVDPVGLDATPETRLRDDLLGLEVALANGERTRAGGRVVKNVTGFDLVRLYCGSFGTLGVVTRAIVRLRAAPEREAVVRARFATLEAALEALAENGAAGRIALRGEGDGAELFFRLLGSEAEVAAQRGCAPGDAVAPAEWSALRDELARPPAPGTARVRLAGRPSDLALLCRALEGASPAGGTRLAVPRIGVAFACVAESELAELARFAERVGATFAAERAPGAGPAPCDAFGAAPRAVALMRALKARFDPARALSPGRFVAGI